MVSYGGQKGFKWPWMWHGWAGFQSFFPPRNCLLGWQRGKELTSGALGIHGTIIAKIHLRKRELELDNDKLEKWSFAWWVLIQMHGQKITKTWIHSALYWRFGFSFFLHFGKMSDSSSSVSKNGILKKDWLEILTAVIYLNDSRFSFYFPFSESLQPHLKKKSSQR